MSEGIWRVSGGCLEGVWRVSGGCLESVLRVSGSNFLGGNFFGWGVGGKKNFWGTF